MYKEELNKFLLNVEKPARYTGGELNIVVKNPSEVDIRFAFCFPDVYEVGMSHLGMRILYHMLNERPDTYCERVFAPWPDMEEEMKKRNIKLYGLESFEPIDTFDFIGFTLQYEMSYSNIINMLNLAHVPAFSKDRGEDDPIVCAGGPCAYNGEPIADFIDFFMLGEGEEMYGPLLDEYKKWKSEGKTRKEYLEAIASIPGIYVPSFYEPLYNADGTVKEIKVINQHAPKTVKKVVVKNLDKCYFPDKIIVPYLDIVHDRIMLEVFRGCTRGCRFCQAGMIYRPVRERSPERLVELAKKLYESSGYEEMSLSSLSTSDYTKFKELTDGLLELSCDKKVNLALPSLRLDSFSLDLMERISGRRKGSLTFAPEAGSQRMRDVINKNITEDNLMESTSLAFNGGYSKIKLYFMIGLPFETHDDVAEIANLAYKVLDRYYEVPKDKRNKGVNINVSTSSFVPKPFTPFQWVKQDSIKSLTEKQNLLKNKIKSRQISYSWHDSDISYLEAVFARGDRRLCLPLYEAVKRGCKFDGWNDYFKFNTYIGVFKDFGIDPDFYAARQREITEIFPWDHIDVGVKKEFLIREYQKAQRGETTKNCREKCSACGAQSFEGGVCRENR